MSIEGMYKDWLSRAVHDLKSVDEALSREEVKFERRELVSSESERPGGRSIEPSPVIMFLHSIVSISGYEIAEGHIVRCRKDELHCSRRLAVGAEE
jgi:hypothetical protein